MKAKVVELRRDLKLAVVGIAFQSNSISRIMATAALGMVLTVATVPTKSLAQEPEALEEITVTGSHIRRDTFTSSSPLSVLDKATIEGIGDKNIGDILARHPSIVSSIDGSSANFTPQTVGIHTTSLRNLGSSRTLVLVNGRRFVSGTSAGAGYGVDLNAIPTTMIDRVEILTGGQSAAYGSDALAGVVNIITKTDFEGVEINAQVSQSSRSDREQQSLDVTMGKAFSDGNAWISLGYRNDEGLFSFERKRHAIGYFSADTDGDGLADTPLFEGSSHIAGARLIGGGLSIKGDGTPFRGEPDIETSDRLNFHDFATLRVPTTSIFAASGLTLELSKKTTAKIEVNYARVESEAFAEPAPLSVVNDIFRIDRGGLTGIDLATHPLWVGSSAGNQLLAAGVTSLDQMATFRRLFEFGQMGFANVRTTFRMVAALEYEINNDLFLDISAVYGVTEQNQTNFGDINLERAKLALDLEPDGFGGFQCVDANARLRGCVPFNPFGTVDSVAGLAGVPGISPAAVDYLAAPTGLVGLVDQSVVSAILSGGLPFSVGAQDNVSFAAGIEYRREKGSETPDGLRQKGITRLTFGQPTAGDFDAVEVFGELQVPLVAQLNLDLAARFADYSSVGQANSWKVGLDAPVGESVRIRAAVSRAVRAPNISDLFAGSVRDPVFAFDPCNNVDAAATGNVADNCRSITAIQNRIDAFGSFDLTQVEQQSTGTFNSGSPDVQEETADSYTVGLILTPSIWQNFSLALDFYNIEIDGAIRNPSSTTILNRCFDVDPGSFDPTCGGLVFRDPNLGPVLDVQAIANNEDTIETTGLDLEASYYFDQLGSGNLLVSLGANFITKYEVTNKSTGTVQDFKGEVLFPETRINMNFDYNLNDLGVFVQLRYRAKTVDRNDNDIHNENLNNVDSVLYTDLRASYQFGDSMTAYFGVNNLFDVPPPKLNFAHKYFQLGVNSNGTAFDTTRQNFYAGVTARF